MGWLYGLTDDEISEFPGLILSLRPTGDVEVTSRPVERGATITDHAITKPRTFSATVFVSPVPRPEAPGLSIEVKEAVDLLERIRLARQVNTVSIPGRMGPFEDLILTKYTAPTDFESGNGSEIEVEFTSLVLVSAITNAPIPRRPRERPRVNRGPQATREEPRRSLAAALFEDHTGMGLLHSNTPRR